MQGCVTLLLMGLLLYCLQNCKRTGRAFRLPPAEDLAGIYDQGVILVEKIDIRLQMITDFRGAITVI
jgi:hypothetical protein